MHLFEFLVKLQAIDEQQLKTDAGTGLMSKFLWVADNIDFLDEAYIQGTYIKLFLNITKDGFISNNGTLPSLSCHLR